MLLGQEQLLGFEHVSPRVLVKMDVVDSLPTEIEFLWEGNSFIQCLDYWRIPFSYHQCHAIGHSKERSPRVVLNFVEQPDNSEVVLCMEHNLNFPLPLDKDSTLSLVGKFA